MVKDEVYCPMCGDSKVVSTVEKESDFDEEGWYYPIRHVCQIRVCAHQWTTKKPLRAARYSGKL